MKPQTHKDPATDYARKVHQGEIVEGPFVRAACARHLHDLESGAARGLRFNRDAARHALEFFPSFLKVEAEGQIVPFVLMPCWAFVIGSIFGWQKKTSEGWFRRFNQAYVEAGKGSGKSPLAAGIGLYTLTDGELSAEVYSAGAKRDQANILFKDAVTMAARSPALAHRLKTSGKNPVWQLAYKKTNSFFKPLSADKAKSGQRVYCGLVDELHEHKDRYTVDMLKAGFKGRKQPLEFVITNSGFDRKSICWEWHAHATSVAQEMIVDDSFFAFVMSLDEADDPLEDESCWPKTNPGIGITITREYLRSQVADARQIPGRENTVRRLNFCEWTDADKGWMTRNAWVSCEEQLVEFKNGAANLKNFEGAQCCLGVDLAFAFDLAALAFVFPEGNNMLAFIEYFTPMDTAADREKIDRVPYPFWIKQGLIHGVPGKVIRREYLAQRVSEVSGILDVTWAAYDKYRHKELADQMLELGADVPWIEHPQGFRRAGQLPFPDFRGTDGKAIDNPLWMPQSVDQLEARIIERTLRIQPSPVTRWQVSSTVIRDDPAGTGNRVFDKRKSTGRIDGMVALAEANGAAEMKLPVQSLAQFLSKPVMTK